MQYLGKATTVGKVACNCSWQKCCVLACWLCGFLCPAQPTATQVPQMHIPHSSQHHPSAQDLASVFVLAAVPFSHPFQEATREQQTGHLHWLVQLWGDLLVAWAGAALMPASSRWRQACRTDCKDEPRRQLRQCSQAGWRTRSLTCTEMQA